MKPLDWILRGLILAGLATLFIPSIPLPRPGTRPRLILLVDASSSMSSEEKQNQYRQLLAELKGLQGSVVLDAYRFADSLAPLKDPAGVKFNGRRSDIHAALGSLDTKGTDAILLVSDGRHNGPDELGGKLLPIPLHALAIGAKNLPDIGIEELQMLDSIQLRVRLRSNLEAETISRLDFYKGGHKVTGREVKIAADGLTELTVPLPQDGSKTTWRVELDSLPLEDRLDNNTLVFRAPQKSRQLEVLFIAGTISQETELILAALRNLPGIRLSTHVEVAPGRIVGKATKQPDVLVVGPMRTDLSERTQELVRDAVKEAVPVMLISVAERPPSGLRDLIPLKATNRRFDPTPPWQYSPLAELLMAGWHPETGGAENPSQAMCVAKPGAQTLVGKDGAAFIAGANEPVRTVGVELPDLVSAIRRDREGFSSFIRTALAYLVEGEGFPFRFGVEESTDASLRLVLFSEVEVTGGGIQAWLMPDSHALNVIPLSTNSFRLSGTPPAGAYRLGISWNNQRFAPRGGIEITPAPPEQPSRGANYELLAHLAWQNSGELVTITELEELVESIPRRKTFNFKPLQNPLLVILVVALSLVEIWHRRKTGLP